MTKIFDYNQDVNKNAFINWRIDTNAKLLNFITIAEGYSKSSIMLMESILENNKDKKADSLIFPIFMNVNHSIELYLKIIISEANIISSGKNEIHGKHDIEQLLYTAKSKLESIGESKKDINMQMSDLERYIKELTSVIKWSVVK